MTDLLVFFINVGLFTFITWVAAHLSNKLRFFVAYCLFFTTPVLTYFGLMAPLTGFERTNTSYFGLSFLTPFLALLLATKPIQILTKPLQFILVCVNPLYLTCGPIPKSILVNLRFSLRTLRRRFRIVQNDIIIGICFITVIAPSFALPQLKHSMQPIDVLLFGAFFEGYVYFNFAGYSMIAWSAMKLFGIDVVGNFAMPFSSTSVVEYWKKWHISLSHVLSELFFKPTKLHLGVYGAAAMTFFASAIWHGVTINFLLWGLLHAFCWSCSRWLYLHSKHSFLQISLLIFSIVVGRILFSETDTLLLAEKFNTLFKIHEWTKFNLTKIINTSSFKTKFGLILGLLLIVAEFIFHHKSNKFKHYEHLKKPWLSILLLGISVMLGIFGGEGAVYGRR
jgi:alginate O-acetyltransferase complex protein AlgI